MMRIGLFLLTNLAVLVVAGIILSLFGVGSYHGAGGLNLGNLWSSVLSLVWWVL
jgi:heat shock protein HtpX